MGGGSSASSTKKVIVLSPAGEVLLRNVSFKDEMSGVREKFSSFSRLLIENIGDETQDIEKQKADPQNIVLDETATRSKFYSLGMEGSESVILPRMDIIKLLDWVLRLHNDYHRKNAIIRVFSSCMDGQDGLTFEEFCSMYEEIATRVELEIYFASKYAELDTENAGWLTKPNLSIMTDSILIEFAPIWCSKREIIEMKKKLKRLFESSEEWQYLKQSELFEVYDGMLVTIRLINKTRAKFAELTTSGQLGEAEMGELAVWIARSFQQSGIAVTDGDKNDMRADILARFDQNRNGVLSLSELAQLFETIMEKKRWYYTMNAEVIPSQNQQHDLTTKGSPRAFNVITEEEQVSIGISPLVREKFISLHMSGTSSIGLDQATTLLVWMFQSKPEASKDWISEFTSGWSRRLVNFDEFCSMFNATKLKFEIRAALESALLQSFPDGIMDRAKLDTVVEQVLCPAETLGCSVEERLNILNRIVASASKKSATTWTKDDSEDLVASIQSITLIIRSAALKFNELDKDKNGQLEGEEINQMVAWALISSSLDALYRPTSLKVAEARKSILRRVLKGPNGKLSIGEFAIFYDELMESMASQRKTAMYKRKVEGIILAMLDNDQ